MDTNLPHQDSVDRATSLPETPLPESQRTCLRNSPCLQQGCIICCAPTNHVCNLNAALDTTNSPTTNSITTAKPPQAPPNHLIVHLTSMFQNAILENDVFKLDATMKQYARAMTSDPKFVIYDCSDLRTNCNHTMQILCSNAASINLPASLPPPCSTPNLPPSHLPVSNPPNWSPITGEASPTISILGCPQL